MVHRAVFVFGLIALAGCPNNTAKRRARMAVEKMSAFADQMCECKDKPCADKVQDDLTKWATEMAKDVSNDDRPDEEVMKKMTDIGQRYGECLTKAMTGPVTETPPEPTPVKGDPVPSSTTPSPHLPPPSYGTLWADRLWSDARTWARERREGRLLASATFAYIDRHGALDTTDGEVRLVFGRADQSEDKRRLGARPRPTQTHDDCFELSTTTGTWTEVKTDCAAATAAPIRCSAAQIWKRAIAKKAPEEALATVTLTAATTSTWKFEIIDEPRNVHIEHSFADDCPLEVEK